MYKPPENSNRVKSIKSKFENNDENTKTRPIFRKSKTVLDLKSNGNGKANSARSTTPELLSPVKHTKSPKEPLHQSSLSRQLSDPSKCNIKRTPAFRLDRNVQGGDKNNRFLQNKTRYQDTHVKNLPEKLDKAVGKTRTELNQYNFSNLRDKFNNKSDKSLPNTSPKNNIPTCDIENKTDTNIRSNALKFLYAEPVPKSQRAKYISEDLPPTIHNASTLRLSDIIQNDKPRTKPKSDDESSSPSNNKSFSKNDIVYGSLRTKKSIDDRSPREIGAGLSDSLKLALKKPLPHGPAPKKPPRTFLHSANPETTKNVPTSLNLDKNFSKKLNKELKKGVSNGRGLRNDPKYMLDKLESAIKSKGVLLRKPHKNNSNSEEDSDNEKSKLLNNYTPTTLSTQAESAYYSTPATSPKFTLGCLPSLSCASSIYQDIKVPNSSFFVDSEEPVYAEPFEFQVSLEEQLRSILGDSVNNNEEGANKNVVRQSVHYASSPVSDTKIEDFKNLAGFEKSSDQVVDSASLSSTYTSDSMASTPSEENKTMVNNMKVKDFVKVIEGNNKSNGLSPSDTNNRDNGDLPTSDYRIKKLETQLKTTIDKCFSSNLDEEAQQIDDNNSESEIIEEPSDMGETHKFETYVKRVRSRVYCKSPKKKHHLFHCCLLVALNRNIPYIKSKYPEHVKEPFSIAELCFPEVENGPMDTSAEAHCYSLIITNEMGERTFGYCRRVLPEASTTCLPLAYCVLTKNRSPGFYNRILEELEFRHGYPEKFKNVFLEQLYNCKFPLPGETIAINCCKIVSNSELSDCKRDDEVSNENETEFNSTNLNDVNITNKLNCDTSANKINGVEDSVNEQDVDLNSFVIVCNSGEYGTLIKNGPENNTPLNNNRGPSAIIEDSSELSPVSLKRSNSFPSTPNELESLPSELVFNRPHDSRHEEDDLKLLINVVKLPILQKVFSSLLLERKVILVSGMLSKLSSCINALQIILYPFSWQHTIIPVLPKSLWEIVDTPTPLLCGVLSSEVVQHYVIDNAIVVNLDTNEILLQVGDEDSILPDCLTQTLKAGLSLANTMTTTNSGTHNIFLSDAFLRVFIQCCSHYKDHVKAGNFEKPEFIQQSKYKGKHIRQFLKWFTETTMFYFFSQAAITKSNSLDLFEQRIKIYCSESATVILNKMKGWSNYKSFLRPNRFQ